MSFAPENRPTAFFLFLASNAWKPANKTSSRRIHRMQTQFSFHKSFIRDDAGIKVADVAADFVHYLRSRGLRIIQRSWQLLGGNQTVERGNAMEMLDTSRGSAHRQARARLLRITMPPVPC
jgi:hypothetical protein